MPDIHLIPLAEIDDAALMRDRTGLDPEALRELRDSIQASGLRMPVELYPLPHPHGDLRYGIVSGFRRIAAFRELHGTWGFEAFAAIPAFLREPADLAAALALMVEENAVRADLSPWEQARIAVHAADLCGFTTVEEAIARLYPAANPMKRSRLRSLALVVEHLEGPFTAPEGLSERQLLRIAAAIRNNFADPILVTLQATRTGPDGQWQAILPYLESESLHATDPEPDPGHSRIGTRRPRETRGRPRRELVVRREIARDGYVLRFTGKEATSAMLDTVLDDIERMYSKE
jgi:ParB family transcriptional regulator, chromosome partitioning protein